MAAASRATLRAAVTCCNVSRSNCAAALAVSMRFGIRSCRRCNSTSICFHASCTRLRILTNPLYVVRSQSPMIRATNTAMTVTIRTGVISFS
ncbi:Uncharacterised protein [Mycobacteroides abscessus subsp. abscessus]|nr:Uncharacterised protein [Mycobacteroides abscessus subsp. abscessus]